MAIPKSAHALRVLPYPMFSVEIPSGKDQDLEPSLIGLVGFRPSKKCPLGVEFSTFVHELDHSPPLLLIIAGF